MNLDWDAWHRHYDDPEAKFSKRLASMHALLAEALDERPPGPIAVLDICAGHGRVTLPLILTHARGFDVRAVLIDSDPRCCDAAREFIAEHALANVEVIHGDAGASDSYVGCPRADIVILSGVIRYLTRRDLRRTLRALAQVGTSGVSVLWSQGGNRYLSIDEVRRTFKRAGFRETALREHGGTKMAQGAGFVGAFRMTAEKKALVPGVRWFQFRASPAGRLGHMKRIVHRVMKRKHRLMGSRSRPRAR